MSESKEPTLTITMPINAWQTVIAHLRVGIYDHVTEIISTIGWQAAQQMEDAQLAERLREEREAMTANRSIEALKLVRSVH